MQNLSLGVAGTRETGALTDPRIRRHQAPMLEILATGPNPAMRLSKSWQEAL